MPEILFTAEQIRRRVAELAGELRRDFPDQLHLVAVLNGAFIFTADLVRAIEGPLSLDFIALSSYGHGSTSSGEVRLLKDLETPIEGLNVVIVEDIVDSGTTLAYLQEILRARAPRALSTVCLLDKPSPRRATVGIDYVGFTIPDRFVVGYGLDHAGRHRNLPHIATLDT